MKRFWFLGLVLILVLSIAPFAVGQDKDVGKPGGVIVDVITVKATVQKIDQANRIVAIKGPHGKVIDVKVNKDVKNFDQIKEGDQVVAKYVESLAIFVEKTNEKSGVTETKTVELAPRGYKPGRVVADTVELTAEVLSVNYAKRILELKLPDGKISTVNVGTEVKRFDKIKKGDEVFVRHTITVALSVEKPS